MTPELLLTPDRMTLSVPFGREIRVDAVRKHPELVGNEGQQRRTAGDPESVDSKASARSRDSYDRHGSVGSRQDQLRTA